MRSTTIIVIVLAVAIATLPVTSWAQGVSAKNKVATPGSKDKTPTKESNTAFHLGIEAGDKSFGIDGAWIRYLAGVTHRFNLKHSILLSFEVGWSDSNKDLSTDDGAAQTHSLGVQGLIELAPGRLLGLELKATRLELEEQDTRKDALRAGLLAIAEYDRTRFGSKVFVSIEDPNQMRGVHVWIDVSSKPSRDGASWLTRRFILRTELVWTEFDEPWGTETDPAIRLSGLVYPFNF